MDTEPNLWSDQIDQAVERLAEVFAERSVRYALIGGLATSLRGRFRTTQDADFLVDIPQLTLPFVLDDLVRRGFTLDPMVVIKQYVEENLTAFRFGAVRIDWIKPAVPIYAHIVAGSSSLEWTPGHPVLVASAEGLILTKMIAFRSQDQIDISTLITANRDTLNVEFIREEWAFFAPIEPERTSWLESLIEKLVVRRE